MIDIEATELRYLSFVLLTLIELDMVLGTVDVPLKCLALLALRSALCHLLHTQASRDFLLLHAGAASFVDRWNW